MTKAAKLLEKLKNGSLDAQELRTLLKQNGWVLERVKGSHEVWTKDAETFILATHSKDLKRYQVKEAQRLLLK
jgi:predicted RNA binding protein YcfA (HicA-like mRNA interferase family)